MSLEEILKEGGAGWAAGIGKTAEFHLKNKVKPFLMWGERVGRGWQRGPTPPRLTLPRH